MERNDFSKESVARMRPMLRLIISFAFNYAVRRIVRQEIIQRIHIRNELNMFSSLAAVRDVITNRTETSTTCDQ